jgi:selenocysteine lyase/cysteine desulfurase
MENKFEKFRRNTIGHHLAYTTPYGKVNLIYADWVASGRLYKPIEKRLINDFGPYVANTHTETSETGKLMTNAYHHAHTFIKSHVNAGKKDVIITAGFGMTTVINKFQRILGLKTWNISDYRKNVKENDRPVVFITHMEHHSNHTSWFETICDVVVVEPDKNLLIDLNHLEDALKKYKNRKIKIGSFTAASNVSGIETPYHKMAGIMHRHGGLCFVDFAMSAPYVKIDMHPKKRDEYLDAVMFSPHKFLGGPGTSGVLVFNSDLYHNLSPDQPGGGTVNWTNPWGEYSYIDDIELREDGGTPGFLQAIKASLCIELKNEMGISNMRRREDQLLETTFRELRKIPNVHILADNVEKRLGVVSFYIDDIHYNLVVRLLSDRFGVQVRGGCACAGTYGHYLLHVSHAQSRRITKFIDQGDLSLKPGWVRLSLHPTMTNKDLARTIEGIRQVAMYGKKWETDYKYSRHSNEFTFKNNSFKGSVDYLNWFRPLDD